MINLIQFGTLLRLYANWVLILTKFNIGIIQKTSNLFYWVIHCIKVTLRSHHGDDDTRRQHTARLRSLCSDRRVSFVVCHTSYILCPPPTPISVCRIYRFFCLLCVEPITGFVCIAEPITRFVCIAQPIRRFVCIAEPITRFVCIIQPIKRQLVFTQVFMSHCVAKSTSYL